MHPLPVPSADPRPALEALSRCLEQILSLHESLCAHADEKRQALVRLRAADVERTTAAEQTLLESVAGVEVQRAVLTAQLARHFRLEPRGVRLGDLCTRAPEPYAARLGGLRNSLQAVGRRLQRANRLNAALVSQSLSHTETMLRLITGGGAGTTTYDRSGTVAERPAAPRALVDQVA